MRIVPVGPLTEGHEEGLAEAADNATFLRAALDATGLVVVVVDRSGRVLTCNRAFERAAACVEGAPIWDYAGAADERELLRDAFEHFDAESFPAGFLFHLATDAGTSKVIDWSTRVLDSTEGGPAVVLSGIDLSERLRAEKRLSGMAAPDVARRLLLDRIPAIIWTTDRELRFTSSAGGALDGLALEPGQVSLVGTSLYSYFQTTDPNAPVIASHLGALRGEHRAFEIPWLERLYQACVEPFVDESGQVIGCVGIALDITERTEAERSLRASETRQRRLFESNVLGILFWSSDGRVLQANNAFLDLVGYTRDELASGAVSWERLTPPDCHALDARAIVEIRATGTCTSYEKAYIAKDGSRVPVLLGAASLDDPRPEAVFEGVAFVIDMRERAALLEREQSARRETEQANARLRLLAQGSERLAQCLRIEDTLSTLAEMVVPTMADWSYVVHLGWEGSPRLVATAHRDAESRQVLRELHGCVPDADAPEGAPRVIRTGEALLYEDIRPEQLEARPGEWPLVGTSNPEHLRVVRSLGMRSLLCVPIHGRKGVDAAMMLVSTTDPHRYSKEDSMLARDLANRAAVSLENGRLLSEALEAVRGRDEFLSIAAHELRTPMTSLLLRTETLQRAGRRGELDSDNARRAVDATEKQARRLSSLIDDLLDVSRVATNGMPINVEELNLSQLVRDVVGTMAGELRRAGCDVEIQAPEAVNGRWDRTRMEQVMANLLSNAMKFGAGHPITVKVEDTPEEVHISVRDHGIGISVEDQARIFGRFERAVSTRHFGGLGLGLYISAQILRAHGGSMGVESEPGKGACFTLSLRR